MPVGYSIWLFLKNNPAARWAAASVAALVAFFTWLALRDRRIRREAVLKQEIKARKTADKVLGKLEKESDERIEKANQAADAVTGDITSDGVRDDIAGLLFSDAERD